MATGLRERKKEQTRQLIAEAAQALFVERGFDAVTVADVAQAADVSVGTVFNYFPTKEELFYGQMQSFESRLLEAVRDRPASESALDAFRRLVLDGTGRLASDEAVELITTAARIVGASRALQARELEIVARSTGELAALLAEERRRPPDDVEAATVAAALMGVQRSLVANVHAAVAAGVRGRKLVARTRAEAKRGFARLEAGLADYGRRSGVDG